MNKIISILIVLFATTLLAQTRIAPENNLSINDSANIKLIAGKYIISDAERDGILQLRNVSNVVIDGDSVELVGQGFNGYGIYISNCSNVVIKNFKEIRAFFYAVKIDSSDNITIENCDFSNNKRDESGWINIWTDVEMAHGGSVLMNRSRACTFNGNVMKESNDGIAMYHSDSITITNNDLSYNMAYAIRMYFCDSNYVVENNGSHVYREDPVHSEAAGILMIVSNENYIAHNDFSYSSDGVFLGQYRYHHIPNNNVFLYNDCSYSPHNAIEATFADGNIYKHNICNYSGYGFWLGYSFNSVIDSNIIIGNDYALSSGTAGIAIDKGFNNQITNNIIEDNTRGVWIWAGGVLPPYEDQESRNYIIENNTFRNNGSAIFIEKTDKVVFTDNIVENNEYGMQLREFVTDADFHDNWFAKNEFYSIENRSRSYINATNNAWYTMDTLIIKSDIYDYEDNNEYGRVQWQPFKSVPDSIWLEVFPPYDLTEKGNSEWIVITPEDQTVEVSYDSITVTKQHYSLSIENTNGLLTKVRRRNVDQRRSKWNMKNYSYISFWMKTESENVDGIPFFILSLGNYQNGSITYAAYPEFGKEAPGEWVHYTVPLDGSNLWQKTSFGNINEGEVNFIEFEMDTYKESVTIWIDGLSFYKPSTPEWQIFRRVNSFLPVDDVRALAFSNDGNYCIGTYGGGLVMGEGEGFQIASHFENTIVFDSIAHLETDSDGSVLLFTDTKGDLVLKTVNGYYDRFGSGIYPDGIINDITIDRNNRGSNDSIPKAYVGTMYNGLFEYGDGSWTQYTLDNSSIPSNTVNSLFIDDNGMLWMGTQQGVVKYDGTDFVLYGEDYNLLGSLTYKSFAQDKNGDILIATWGKTGIMRFDGVTPAEAIDHEYGNVFAEDVVVDEHGIIYLSCWYRGLLQIDGESRMLFTPSNSGLQDLYLSDIEIDADNKVWVCTRNGLVVYSNSPTTIEQDKEISTVEHFQLFPNYPNPFNPETTISYGIPAGGNVVFSVYNTLGEKVANSEITHPQSGTYEILFNGSELSTGIYYYSIRYTDTIGSVQSKKSGKMLLLK